jgi:hypothetical protein
LLTFVSHREDVEDRWDRIKCPMLPAHDDDDNIEV